MKRDPLGISTSRWGLLVVAAVLLPADYLWPPRGLSHLRPVLVPTVIFVLMVTAPADRLDEGTRAHLGS